MRKMIRKGRRRRVTIGKKERRRTKLKRKKGKISKTGYGNDSSEK